MSRTIKVMSTDGTTGITPITDDVTTWGQLKEAMGRKGLASSNIKGLVRGSRITLEDDSAILPDGDISIFITPTKVKSGLKQVKQEFLDFLETYTNKYRQQPQTLRYTTQFA